ncbi:hypothetical protein IQ250_04535 [Pseudanabaenaceae cyanobacterium LEGE 13415]|nr:hypothetical protein [Pseudanabaenaceae cyanobacterium LEGE 13415]
MTTKSRELTEIDTHAALIQDEMRQHQYDWHSCPEAVSTLVWDVLHGNATVADVAVLRVIVERLERIQRTLQVTNHKAVAEAMYTGEPAKHYVIASEPDLPHFSQLREAAANPVHQKLWEMREISRESMR